MWIRSQNKLTLQNVKRFVIEQFKIGIYIVGDGCTLGVYSTKEKALKVLDEIQDAIEDTGFYRIDNIGHGTYAFSKGVLVYQMPQDEDVIV